MSLVESVEDIVVSALARQDRFARNDGIHMTPEKAAALRVGDWLRSQASADSAESEK